MPSCCFIKLSNSFVAPDPELPVQNSVLVVWSMQPFFVVFPCNIV